MIVNGYATREQLKAHASLTDEDDDLDDLLDAAVNAASRGIDHYTKRHFYQADETRRFAPSTERLVLFGTYGDLTEATEVAYDLDGSGDFATVAAPESYELGPPNAGAYPEPRPYRHLVVHPRFPRASRSASRYYVRVAGVWGWPAVPDLVHQACLIQAFRLLKRREAPEGTVGLNIFGTVQMSKLDVDVERMIRQYRIKAVG